jgi:hypothetical protein
MSQPPDFPSPSPSPKPRYQISAPRLGRSQMLALLREAGVPETEARRWIDAELALAAEPAMARG